MNPTTIQLCVEFAFMMLIGGVSGYVCTGVLYPMKLRYNGSPVVILPIFGLLCFGIVGTLIMLYSQVFPHTAPFFGDSPTILVAFTALVAAYFPGAGVGVLKPVFKV